MNYRTSFLAVAAFALGVGVPVAFALQQQPEWVDDEFRRCMADAVDREMSQRVEALGSYADAQVHDLGNYRNDLQSAWQVRDEDDRRDALRDADRRYRDASRQTNRDYNDRIRDIRNESRQAQRDCRERHEDHEDFVEDLCFSSQDCRANQQCSTERGACDSACPPDAQNCIQVCAGTCERRVGNAGGFGSSRSSFRSSSSAPVGGGTPGLNCTPYRCADGRPVPSCDDNGNLINYTSNPCYT